MPSEEFEELVKEIKENDKEFTITPRKLLNAFNLERRTQNNQNLINKFGYIRNSQLVNNL